MEEDTTYLENEMLTWVQEASELQIHKISKETPYNML